MQHPPFSIDLETARAVVRRLPRSTASSRSSWIDPSGSALKRRARGSADDSKGVAIELSRVSCVYEASPAPAKVRNTVYNLERQVSECQFI